MNTLAYCAYKCRHLCIQYILSSVFHGNKALFHTYLLRFFVADSQLDHPQYTAHKPFPRCRRRREALTVAVHLRKSCAWCGASPYFPRSTPTSHIWTSTLNHYFSKGSGAILLTHASGEAIRFKILHVRTFTWCRRRGTSRP